MLLIFLGLTNAFAGLLANRELLVHESAVNAWQKPIVHAESDEEARTYLRARGWPSEAVDAYIRFRNYEVVAVDAEATLMRYARSVLKLGRLLLFLNAGVCAALATVLWLQPRRVPISPPH